MIAADDVTAWIGLGLTVLSMLAGFTVATFKLFRRLDHMSEQVAEGTHLVRYHLGPNGDSPRLYKRVGRIEGHLGIHADPDDDMSEP